MPDPTESTAAKSKSTSDTGEQLATPAPQSADDRAALVAAEYSKYIANSTITYGNANAYTVGMPVALSAVEGPNAWVNPEQVDKVTTKAAQTSLATAAGLEVKE